MDCDFCKKNFSSVNNLRYHQKTAKYCLEIQGKSAQNFFCDFCKKTFTLQNSLTKHGRICRDKKQSEEIDKQKAYEKDLKEKLKEKDRYYKEKLAERERLFEEKEKMYKHIIERADIKLTKFEDAALSGKNIINANTHTNNTNNTNNNQTITLNLSPENVREVLSEHLTPSVLGGGQKALAHLVQNKILKGSYVCTDPSRQMFEFVNEDGQTEKDMKAKKLSKALIQGDLKEEAIKKSERIWTDENGQHDQERFYANIDKVTEIINFPDDNKKFRSELAILATH